jgi:dolichol-phosphate mannosyltransferase
VLDSPDEVDSYVLLVDDGSTDGTLDALNSLARDDERLLICSLSRNFGHQAALSAGLDLACGDAVVMLDSDLQHPPDLIPGMVSLWQQGYDVVQGVRQEISGASLFKRFFSSSFYKIFNGLSDTHLVPGAADFCLLSRRAHIAVMEMPERRRFLRGLISWIGFERTVVPYQAPKRFAGRSKYSVSRMIKLAFDALVSFTPRPLTLAMRVGTGVAVLGGIYLLYSFITHLLGGETVAGWTSLICTILILGGIQLVFIGLIGEYLAGLLDEVKHRPSYIVKQHPRIPFVEIQAPVEQSIQQ